MFPFVSLLALSMVSGETTTRSWEEAETLARSALSTLSIQQKITLVSGMGWQKGPCVGNIDRVNIPGFEGLCLQDSPAGVRFAFNVSSYPASINVAATFDRDLMLRHGQLMGKEFRGKGVNVALGPMMDVLRAPAAGRIWEGQGADPYLNAQSARLQVRGIQQQGVIATAKHYIANQQENFRYSSSSNIDQRTFREIYLAPFQACVEEGVGAIMCAYNYVNNTYACEDDYTINQVLKRELGFKGFVMTDWWATADTTASANGGSDMMMPGSVSISNGDSVWGNKLLNEIKGGRVTERRIDDMSIRILSAWYKMGQDKGFPKVNFDSWDPSKSQPINVQGDHAKHIREVGGASSILLKNNGILPLKKTAKYAVVGSDAGPGDSTNNNSNCPDHGCSSGTIAQGWGSGTANFPYIVTPYEGILKKLSDPNNVKINFNDFDTNGAKNLAANADVAIVFVSANSGEEYITVQGNRGDRNDLKLWNNGDNLIRAVAEANKPVVVVIHSPGAVDMPWLNHPNVAAVVMALFPGQESGNAIADVLFGDVNPSGRLPFTVNDDISKYSAKVIYQDGTPGFPRLQINYDEKLLADYRWNDAKGIEPLFEFGYGLSYSTFVYSGFDLSQNMINQNFGGRINVSFQVNNSGPMDGHEVAQLYLGFPASAGEPPKLLKDFDRKLIRKGETATFTLGITTREMQIWDVVKSKWVVPSGTYQIYIGSSSRRIHYQGSFQYQ